ncbi:uncharacterized protein V6R79_005227 [Siganus canaliculatus]
MLPRSNLEDEDELNKEGCSSGGSPEWDLSGESALHSNSRGPGHSISDGRRLSSVSDSGDTGIGTYSSDSVEDISCPCPAPWSFHPLTQKFEWDNVPTDLVKPSFSPDLAFSVLAANSSTSYFGKSYQMMRSVMSPLSVAGCLDRKYDQPIRRSSSLNKLSSGTDKSFTKSHHDPLSQESMDRKWLCEYRQGRLGSNPEICLRSPGARPYYRFNHSSGSDGLETGLPRSSALTSPVKYLTLDNSHRALPESKLDKRTKSSEVYSPSLINHTESPQDLQTTGTGSRPQSSVRTQMWLTEQVKCGPMGKHALNLGHINTRTVGDDAEQLVSQQQEHQPPLDQKLMVNFLPVNTTKKVKVGLLRQRELELDRQKQQILHLYAQIRENECRAQHVLQSTRGWFDNHHIKKAEESAMRTPGKRQTEDLGRKLALAELKVVHLKQSFMEVTQKYTEDIRKLEEKMRTRDRYISCLKKKYQRESDQNQEKQQRIETLEKYLSDLPTLDEVHAHFRQREEVQRKAKDLESRITGLQKNLEEGCALMVEKNMKIEMKAKREKNLIASVHSMQRKVQQCLHDGARLPVQNLKQLEVENTKLLEQQDYSRRLFEQQKEQIERLTSQLMATSTKLQKKRDIYHGQQSIRLEKEERSDTSSTASKQQLMDGQLLVLPLAQVEMPEVGQLLEEMSLCLLDLQALCGMLTQRAQGKELNLSLLLGMKSLSFSAEKSDCSTVVKEELRFKLLEVSQLRRDIDELRKSIL